LKNSTWRNSNTVSIRDVMKDALRELRINSQLESRKIEQLWHKMMPAGVTRATTGMEFYNNRLVIHLSNAPLRQELVMGKDKIIAKLNEELPADMQVKELFLR
jgi:hypothetical protein